MKKTILFALSCCVLTSSCFKKKAPDPVAEQLKIQLKQMAEIEKQRKIDQDLKEKEAIRKEAAEKRKEAKINAPIKAGEFGINIIPDANVTDKFLIPVHILTMTESQAENYRGKSAASYWRSPSSVAKEIKFGTSGQAHSHTGKIPFKVGDNAVVIITKIPGANDSNSVIVRTLKRNDDLSPSLPIRYALTEDGFLAL